MSRRILLIVAASVCAVYFTVILLILNPIDNESKFANVHNRIVKKPVIYWCNGLHRLPSSRAAVALVSFPGSGNTWLRYLLQQATGIETGSIYMDYGLKINGFPAENVTDGSVLVVKTHEAPSKTDHYKSAILLIRNPRDAILAEYNRLHRGHIGSVPISAFKTNTVWSKFVTKYTWAWEELHKRWLTQFSWPIDIIFYEHVVEQTAFTVNRILAFLNHNITEESMQCMLRNKEGIYRRPKRFHNYDPFTPPMYYMLRKAENRVKLLILNRKSRSY